MIGSLSDRKLVIRIVKMDRSDIVSKQLVVK